VVRILDVSRKELCLMGSSIALIGAALVALMPATGIAQDDQTRAATYLRRVARAQEATYSCRRLVAYFGDPQSAAAMLDVRSSKDGQFVRVESGSATKRMWLDERASVLTSRSSYLREAAPTRVPLRPDDVLAKYEVDVGSKQRLFGVEVVPLTLVRRRDRAMIEQWLVHPQSGIVYQRELYDEQGKLVGMSTITDMKWGASAAAKPEPIEKQAKAPSTVRSSATDEAPEMLPLGYRLLRGYRLEADGRPAEQWVYSDGLHALSVFSTSGGLQSPEGFTAAEGRGADGLWVGPGPGTWAWEGGGRTWTVVAEESALDPVELIEAFPRGGPSFWARLGSLWSRLFGAIGGLFS
jgi:hypothetical protein